MWIDPPSINDTHSPIPKRDITRDTCISAHHHAPKGSQTLSLPISAVLLKTILSLCSHCCSLTSQPSQTLTTGSSCHWFFHIPTTLLEPGVISLKYAYVSATSGLHGSHHLLDKCTAQNFPAGCGLTQALEYILPLILYYRHPGDSEFPNQYTLPPASVHPRFCFLPAVSFFLLLC